MFDQIAALASERTTMKLVPGLKMEKTEASPKFEEVLTETVFEIKDEDIPYMDIFEAASKEYGVPLPLLLAVAKAESSFNAEDVSRSGAMGVMQLMPATAKELGVKNAFDPEENIMGGAKYLSQKLLQYGGNLELTLAAYNAGSGNVEKYGGIPPFQETQNYVKKVLGYMEEYEENSEKVVSTTKKVSVKEETKSRTEAYIKELEAAFLAQSGSNEILAAYEEMKEKTHWLLL